MASIGPNGMSTDSSDTRFTVLERTLDQFQENARQMGFISCDFSVKSQEPLNQKIHTMISGLKELDALKNQFTDIRVPIELLDYLDQGKNPQLYTRECLERTMQKNKEVNGKIELYKKFHAMLLNELGLEMPADLATYLSIRKINADKDAMDDGNS